MDLYTITTEVMDDVLKLDGISAVPPPRKIVKPAVMTFFYGSKEKPKEAFGEDTDELWAFYEALKVVAPEAYKLMPILIDTWQPYATEHCWTMPDGFRVRNKVTVMKDTKIEVDELEHATFKYRHEAVEGLEEGLANAANVVHSIDGFVNRELCRRCNFDPTQLKRARKMLEFGIHTYQKSGALCNRTELFYREHGFMTLAYIDHINHQNVASFSLDFLQDLWELVNETLTHHSIEVVSVHDEFKCHPNNMNRVRQVYIEVFAELAEANLLNTILTELTGEKYNLVKASDDLGDEIRLGNYAIS
jgi:hypothetical protein